MNYTWAAGNEDEQCGHGRHMADCTEFLDHRIIPPSICVYWSRSRKKRKSTDLSYEIQDSWR